MKTFADFVREINLMIFEPSPGRYRVRYTGDLEKIINFIRENANIEHELWLKQIHEINVNERWENGGKVSCSHLSTARYEAILF